MKIYPKCGENVLLWKQVGLVETLKLKFIIPQKILSRWTEFSFAGRKNALRVPEETNLEPVQRTWVWWRLWKCRRSNAILILTSAKSLFTKTTKILGGKTLVKLNITHFTCQDYFCFQQSIAYMSNFCMNKCKIACVLLFVLEIKSCFKLLDIFKGCISNSEQKHNILKRYLAPPLVVLFSVFCCFHCVEIVDWKVFLIL